MKKLITLFVFIALNSFCFTQYFYLPSSSLGNPNGLNNDNEYPLGSGLDASWEVLLAPGNTNPTWSSIDTIPFVFNFNGNPVIDFKVSSSGVLTFSTSAVTVPGFVNASLPDPAIPDNSIMVWGIEGTGSNDAIVTKTFGNLGSQQYWIFFSSYTAGSWTYWSIVLEEGSDKIYLVDQRHSGNATPQITAGIQIDNSNTIMVTGSPQLGNLAGTNATPADNHYYEFTYGSQNTTDISGIEISSYPYQVINDAPYTITGIFRNLGIDTVTSMDINYAINGGNFNTETVNNLNLYTYENDTFDFNNLWTPSTIGTYDITIWASNINGNLDLNNSNDTIHKMMHIFDNTTARKPMLEAFVSSTSTYSVSGNTDLGFILNDNIGDYTLIKYPMSWPTPGDPYYTYEGGQRKNYYSVNTVPRLVMNGVLQNNPIGFTQQEFDEAYNMYSFLELSADYSVGGQVVDINVDINSLCNTAGIWDNLVLHAAIFEYTTYNNIGTNNEIEFYNIMKKMVPDQNGTVLPNLLGPNNPSTNINLSYTFNGGYTIPSGSDNAVDHGIENTVEDFQNLGVAVWVQDNDSKYILQSAEATLVTGINNQLLTDKVSIYPNPAQDYINIQFKEKINNEFYIETYNMLGEKVNTQDFKDISNEYITIDTKSLKSGNYTIVINGVNSKQISKKINILK